MSLSRTDARIRDAVVFTFPRIAITAGLRGVAALRGKDAAVGILAPGSGTALP